MLSIIASLSRDAASIRIIWHTTTDARRRGQERSGLCLAPSEGAPSRHVLDEEKEVQKVLDHYQLMHGDSEIDFLFADSKVVPEIQLSDIVVGFLGKYFTFIGKTLMSTLLRIRKNLTKTQAQTLKLLGELIDISDKMSNALLFRFTTMDNDWKSDAFLHGNGFPPHLL